MPPVLTLLGEAVNTAVRVLLAPSCAACTRELARPLESPVCPECWQALPAITPPWCERCGDALPSSHAGALCVRCRRMPTRTLVARSAGRYDGSLRQMIHAFKYEQRRLLARPLASLLARTAAEWLAEADAVIPVPLHPVRAWQRGFNQADDLARVLGPPVWLALRRRRQGPPQASLPAARRHGNVRGAFTLARWSAPVLGPSWRKRLQGKRVVLVDDVMTTGATLEACGRVLEAAGVRTVRALTVARAVTGRPASPPPPRLPSPVPRR